MAEYIDREKLIPDRCYHEPEGYEAVSVDQIFHEDIANVVEREKIDNTILELEREMNSGVSRDAVFHDGIRYAVNVLKRNIK